MASAASAEPGLIRSFTHRLARDERFLPTEGLLPSFDGATGWLNSAPLSPDELRGRVLLVNFWTYTCVNWIRTLPYLRAWATKYTDAGLTIVGVHTPEFGFEHDVDNVAAAAKAFDVRYPVALDNDYAIWNAYANRYWPAIYLADVDGRIRYHHFGEGEYAATELAIQQLLIVAGAENVDQSQVTIDPQGLEVAADWQSVQSPETYLGHQQGAGFAQGNVVTFDEPAVYAAPAPLPLNSWGLSGTWTIAGHAAVSNEPGGRVAFQFHARDLNLVMGPTSRGASIPFQVFLDGQPAEGAYGVDIAHDGQSRVTDQRTYQLIRQSGPIASRRFEIEFGDAGVEAYCFTFG